MLCRACRGTGNGRDLTARGCTECNGTGYTDDKPATPTLQGHLFNACLAENVTQQRDLFGPSDPRPAGPRIPDLPGQTYLDSPNT